MLTAFTAGTSCFASLALARLAVVLRRRQAVAVRLPDRADVHRDRRSSPVSVTIGATWLAATVLGAGLGGARLAVLAGGAVPAACAISRRVRIAQGTRRYEAALPAALEEIARGLRSGGSLASAMAEASATGGPVAADLARVVAEAATVGVVEALEAWAARRDSPTVALASAALALAHETGGPQAAAVDGVADGLRQRLAMTADLRAAGAQARISATVMVLAPAVFAAVTSAADPRFRTYLFGSSGGTAMLAGGVGLDLAGALWMARLTRVAA